MADRVTIELIKGCEGLQAGCESVIARYDDQLVQTPWLIAEGENIARDWTRKLREAKPDACFTLIGFTE